MLLPPAFSVRIYHILYMEPYVWTYSAAMPNLLRATSGDEGTNSPQEAQILPFHSHMQRSLPQGAPLLCLFVCIVNSESRGSSID